MKTSYLFPSHYKRIGWIFLIPSIVIGVISLIYEIEPQALEFKVPALFIDKFLGENKLAGIVTNNLFNEIIGVFIIVSSVFVAFSREKFEDEYISKIRLESLVWAVYTNYIVLLLALLFIYDYSFMFVMIFNMFTILLFFIVRFYWQLNKLKKQSRL